jgi:hypothetical protein
VVVSVAMLERSAAALRHAQRARGELFAVSSATVDTPATQLGGGRVAIGMDPLSTKRRDDYLYHFRCVIALLMAVGPTINDEVGSAGGKDWWKPSLHPHATQLMNLRDPVLKHTDPPASAKNEIQGRLVQLRDGAGNLGPVQAVDIKIRSSQWTWDSGPYAGEDVLAVIDLYLDLLEKKLLPEAERLIRLAGR